MNWDAISYDWNQIKAFLATVEQGSLSGAARALGMTQPTLNRHVSGLESSLGVQLFERSNRAMTLTQTGQDLLEHVRDMGEAAMRISLCASGQSQSVTGRVKITATDMLTTYLLPSVIAELRKSAPTIEIQLIPSNDIRDLKSREADIAIRHARPDQPDLITKLLGHSQARLYASKDYLEEHGYPTDEDSLLRADFIGFNDVEQFLPTLNALGLPLKTDNFKITTTNGATLLELVRYGLGMSVLPRHIADVIPDLECVLPDYSIPVPLWLVTHSELRTSRKIRLVFNTLAKMLPQLYQSNPIKHLATPAAQTSEIDDSHFIE